MTDFISVYEFIKLISTELGRPDETGALLSMFGFPEDTGESGEGSAENGAEGNAEGSAGNGAEGNAEGSAGNGAENHRYVSRTEAAKILYNTMVYFTPERDEKDISCAGRLKDLYDCRKCVKYIAQMYAKGIIPAMREKPETQRTGEKQPTPGKTENREAEKEQPVFGTSEKVTGAEAVRWIRRLFNKEKRLVPEPVSAAKVKKISFSEAAGLAASTHQKIILADMREEYGAGIEASDLFKKTVVRKMSLQQIKINPYSITPDTEQPVMLLCDYGVKSAFAGEILEKFGFSCVFVIDNPT